MWISPLTLNPLDILISANVSFTLCSRDICPTLSVTGSTETKPTVHVLFGEVHRKSISHLK